MKRNNSSFAKVVFTTVFSVFGLFASVPATGDNRAQALLAAPMMTPWGEKITSESCYREYPRPQMVRGNWECLNGDDIAEFEREYLSRMERLAELAALGLGGSVYTQTTDVEVERNGLLTYDRRVLKLDAAKLKAAHEKVIGNVR